jgi:hypothetical protein
LPLWILSTDLWTTNKHELTSVKALTRGKVVHPHNKEKAICIITNNFTPFRAELIHRFRSIGYMVDVYGQHFKPVLDKGLLMSQYTFSLCPENSIYPGYVTEKIIHAAFSNTVPIYTGGIEHEGLEMNAFLYLDSDLQNFNNIVTKMNTKLESTSIYLPPLASHSVITAKCSKIEQSIEKILSLYSYE